MKRFIAVAGALLLLAGCKLVIRAPEGAAVVSSSGLYSCPAGTECTAIVDHFRFDESFTVVPEPGHQFVAWSGGEGYFCAGSTRPDCGRLVTSGLSGRPGPAAVLRDPERAFYLAPVMSVAYAPAASRTGLVPLQQESVTVTHFPVAGASVAEISSSLFGADNPLPLGVDGLRRAGWAETHFRVAYRAAPVAGRSNVCRLTRLEVDSEHEVVMPEYPALDAAPAGLADRWRAFYRALHEHEAGHVTLARAVVGELSTALQAMGDIPCASVKSQVDTLVERAERTLARRNEAYDTETNHGVYTGAAW